MADDPLLIKLAGAIVEGTEPDWDSAASTAGSRERRQLVEDLRVIADLAAVHRGSGASSSAAAAEVHQDGEARWGPLQLRNKIGSGHFATVYLAWDPVLQRDVAVKLLGDTGPSAEIIQEARLLARVRHPNVVTVYGVDHDDGVVGLWMEFVDGLTLTRVLATRGVLGPREAALIGIDLCRAVAAVHKAGLVHRDIKGAECDAGGGRPYRADGFRRRRNAR
jgi:serine/threonine protein kinase